jgi:hypothetical protein
VETERDPERLFRELMDVSPDGTVPPHLMERLRQLETQRQAPSGVGSKPAAPRRPRPSASRAGRDGGEDQDLYTAFQQLLLEDEEPG